MKERSRVIRMGGYPIHTATGTIDMNDDDFEAMVGREAALLTIRSAKSKSAVAKLLELGGG